MRAHLAVTLVLLAALHASVPWLEPPLTKGADLADHIGETIALEGTVVAIDPGERWHRTTVLDATGRTSVLHASAPSPLGARVRVVGQPDVDRDGASVVVWARSVHVLAMPDTAPLPLALVLQQAPVRAGRPVAVAGTWDPGQEALVSDGHALAVRSLALAPSAGPVVAWGVLHYVPAQATYRLDATGWAPWTPLS